MYVIDFSNHRIQVFSTQGKFLRMFGKYDGGSGKLNRPFGIAIDTSDLVYVSDWDNHRVSVFTSKGQYVTSFGREGEEPGLPGEY